MLPLPLWAQTDNYMTEIIRLQFGVHSQFIDLFLDSIGGTHRNHVWHYAY
jgi:hypothetical protein